MGTTRRIAVTGSSGLLGSELVPRLKRRGHQVLRLVRARPVGRDAAFWDPATGQLDPEVLRDADAVVHLAGHPVAYSSWVRQVTAGRWTGQVKHAIRDSRTRGTHLLATAMSRLTDGPRTLVSMSGISYYGTDRGDEVLTEDSAPGDGVFMPAVCQAWEAAADPARATGVRVVHVRAGISLTPDSGALARMLPLFRLGLGGRLGSGRQWWSWISLDDLLGLIEHALTSTEVHGPLNGTAPAPVTNAEFTRTLGRVLGRPALLPVPRFGPRLLMGEAADDLALESLRVLPERALASGYTFRHPDLEAALRDAVGRSGVDDRSSVD